MHQQKPPGPQLTPIARIFHAGLFGLVFSGAACAADTAQTAQPVPEATLPLISLKADEESASGPVQGYVATRSATGTRTDTPLLETPQSITVIGAQQIETLKPQNITDAMAYSVGAMRLPYVERTGDNLLSRGFVIPMSFRDGNRYQVNSFDGQQEVYGLERIEVLKGAASILYGAAQPGGVLNTVSKRPTTETMRELTVDIGSFQRRQVAGDFAGALSADGAWSYRLTGLKRDSGTSTNYVPDNRNYLAPALKWQPNGATSLTLLSEYQRDHTAYGGNGLPKAGTALPNINGPLPRDLFAGEPGYDHYRIERYSYGYLLEHAFDKLKLNHSLRRYRMDMDWAAISVTGNFFADQRTIARYPEERDEHSSRLDSNTSLQYDWQAAGVAHKTLVGVDYAASKLSSGRYTRAIAPLDLYAPVYGATPGPRTPAYGWISNVKQLGLYVQDQMKFADKWVLLLGGRQDRVRETECDYFDPASCYIDRERSKAFTGRAGVVYLAGNGVAPFASFSQSFLPTSGVDRLRNRFKPTRGEQFEAGVRYQPPGSALMLSATTYQLTQTDVLSTDPVDIRFQVQQGEVRSRGVELEAKGRVGRNTQILGAYTYTDAHVTKASPLYPEQVGLRSNNVPYNQFSLWGDYSFGDFGLAGLKLGAGVRYVDETASQRHSVRPPAFTTADMMVSYSTGPWRLALNVSNLNDKHYVVSCQNDCFYGEPRKVTGSLSYRW